MIEPTVIVWDLETIPDLDAAARILGMTDAPPAGVREALGDKFPKHALHKIVCIGALITARELNGWCIRSLGAPHIGQRSETELIAAFACKIAELGPRLVTFNGHGFDLPVLRYRAMVNKVSAPGFNVRPYFHRYTEDALDLCDALSSYGSNGKTKLDEICKVLGLPGKPDGVNGSNVEQMVTEGRIADVAHYCESDLVNTYLVWLRYLLFCGLITVEQLEWSEAQAAELINARGLRETEQSVDGGELG